MTLPAVANMQLMPHKSIHCPRLIRVTHDQGDREVSRRRVNNSGATCVVTMLLSASADWSAPASRRPGAILRDDWRSGQGQSASTSNGMDGG